MQYGLIGEKLGHSFSKIIHNMLADYNYQLCEIKPDDFNSFMNKRNFKAINVTIPYKKQVIPYLDFISDEAKKIGAVNVVVNKDGKLYGYNSDLGGLLALIKRIGVNLKGKKVLICGTGGTSNTAMTAAKILGASEIVKLSRSGAFNACSYDEAYKLHKDASFIINTTPAGMYPDLMDTVPLDIENFPDLEGIADAVYNPLHTKLVGAALEKGLKAEGGLYMLVMQAVLASEMFLDTKYPQEISDKIFYSVLNSKENIVLIGMPGCGKTTIGQMLSKKLAKKLVDTDALIVEKMQMSIPDIFSKYGEKAFRDIEADVIRDISKETGIIIATGGGAVLRTDNVKNLRLNGKLFFLDRPLKDLMPTDTRPLSSSYKDLKKRYMERYDIYIAAADVHIKGCPNKSSTLKFIEGALKA